MFQISPGVYWREIDLSGTIPAISTSIGVIALRNTYKGPEYEQSLVANDSQLVDKFGKPTDKSYVDMLSAMGYLKYGESLYCTRVMPEDATFAGMRFVEGYEENGTDFEEFFTFNVSGSVDTDDEQYDYVSLGTKDVEGFPEQVENMMDSDDLVWLIAKSRGKWGNNVRVLLCDKDLYNAVKYFDEDEEVVDLPDGVTISEEASAAAIEMYEDYKDNPSFGESGYDDSLGYPIINNLDTPPQDEYQFVLIVQNKDQGGSTFETEETFIVSSDKNALDDSGSSIFFDEVIKQSNYVVGAINPSFVTDEEVDKGGVNVGTQKATQLSGGYNGEFGRHEGESAQLSEDSAVIEAYELYENAEEIDVNLFIESDKGEEVKRKLIEICEVTRKDSFALLDVPKEYVVNNKGNEATDLVKWRKGQGESTFNPNTSYASLYANWLEVYDKWRKKYRWVPTSGFMAGIYANTDEQRDAWWAPAGLNRAVLTGVRRLAFNPKEGERDILYKSGLNPIVSFSGQGKVVWGQKTLLDKQSAFNRVNVRRLFLVLEKAISKSSKYFLFEQNDEVTWMLMRNMINPFLKDVKGRRGLYDYYVQIDETTNTDERIDRNELWGNIWLKPTRSAEFIRLSFIATKTGASFDELIGSGAA